MKRIIILSLFLIITLFSVGCSKGVKDKDEKTGKNRITFVCTKSNIEQKNSGTQETYMLDIKEVAKVYDDKKLTYYSSKSTYKMKSKEQCEKSCSTATKWNDEINAKKYSGMHRVTICNCDKNEYSEERIYDDILNLDKYVRSDIQYLKTDNTFEVDEFIKHYEKYGYICD